ncbi:MAG: ThiF family adenylyltransferase [Gemmataceae bacterium]
MNLLQVGVGSGGIAVLDLLARDPAVDAITLVDPDVYKPHNVVRHLFPPSAVGRMKTDLARDWVTAIRPDLRIETLVAAVGAAEHAEALDRIAAHADFGICAVDGEAAKFAFDALMRKHHKPWTLGEVLSGGIGGFVHGFVPDGPCYGCVASFLQRSVPTDDAKAPDYSQPGGPTPETAVPASKTSIAIVSGLQAQLASRMMKGETPDFTSMLLTLERVPGVFDEAFRPFKFRIARSPECLICRGDSAPADLDRALADALDRLRHA